MKRMYIVFAAVFLTLGCGNSQIANGTVPTPPVSQAEQATARANAIQAISVLEAMPDVATRRAYLGEHRDIPMAFGMAKDDALNARLRRALGFK